MSCGAGTPMDIIMEESGVEKTYKCPDCGDTIIQGIVAEDGNMPDRRLPPSLQQSVIVLDTTDWKTIELWWSEFASCGVIHGRKVSGSQEAYDLLEKVRDIHDSQ